MNSLASCVVMATLIIMESCVGMSSMPERSKSIATRVAAQRHL